MTKAALILLGALAFFALVLIVITPTRPQQGPPPLQPIPSTETVTVTPTTNGPVPSNELQAYPCPTANDPQRMCMNGVPLTPGTTATIPSLPPGLPYSPSGCPANDHPWCANPTPTEMKCGTLDKPTGCIDPAPTDIANANQACADLRANPTDDGVKLVTNRLLDPYGRDGATALLRYATVTICPDMATAVAQEWNNRMRLIGSGPDWDSMWKP